MILPKRIKQHKAESDSYAILLYKLRDIGIFRNLTDNDYGIDFEIEVVNGEAITGKFLKAQVKSSENLRVRRSDKVPVVGGIKESTLYYWTELSYKTNVIAYAVDIKTEKIYITKPIFWQATRLIDGSGKSKSIEFIPVEEGHADVAKGLTYAWAIAPNISDIIHYHQLLLKNIEEYINLYVDVFHYDYHVSVHEPGIFRSFLEMCKIISWNMEIDKSTLSEDEQRYLFIYEYWAKQGGIGYDEIPNYICQKPLKVLMPVVLKCLYHYKKMVLEGKYYWRHRNTYYLRLVYETEIFEPLDTHEEILDFGYRVRVDGITKQNDFRMFIAAIDEEYKKA